MVQTERYPSVRMDRLRKRFVPFRRETRSYQARLTMHGPLLLADSHHSGEGRRSNWKKSFRSSISYVVIF